MPITRWKFSVVTACSRPENLPLIDRTLRPGKKLFDITWYICFDGLKVPSYDGYIPDRSVIGTVSEPESVCGNAQRNWCMAQIKDGWVYFMDDDNCFHPQFWKLVHGAIEKFSPVGVIGSQQTEWGIRPAAPQYVKKEYIDTSQFVVKKSAIGDLQWPTSLYQSDAYMIEHIFAEHKRRFAFIMEAMSYYNRLRWQGVPV